MLNAAYAVVISGDHCEGTRERKFRVTQRLLIRLWRSDASGDPKSVCFAKVAPTLKVTARLPTYTEKSRPISQVAEDVRDDQRAMIGCQSSDTSGNVKMDFPK
nr:hypothetical protein CFP56_30115 [Quercus suber]